MTDAKVVVGMLNLSNNRIRRFFTLPSFISSILSIELFAKIPLVLAPLLLLPYSQGSQALTAHTSQVIQGSAPYLTFDGGRTKVNTTGGLLGIRLSDGTKITPATNNSATTPIILPNSGDTLANIDMLVLPSTNLVSLSDLVTQGNWGDDDGDGLSAGEVTATGSITLSITDKNNQAVNRSDALDICKAPYKVVLSSAGGHLTTRYGVPDASIFTGDSATYYINPKASPVICFIKPNLRYGDTDNPWEINTAGPADIWNPGKGFLVQSTNPASYHRNFPTTGADGLYFDLDVGGGGQLIWSPVTHGGITATMTNIASTSVRVTLTGPRASEAQKQLANPGQISESTLPQTFVLEGRDSSGRVIVKYGFTLQKWFVNRGNKILDTNSNTVSWCRSFGYRVPQIKDLTNAKCMINNNFFPCIGIDGAVPSSIDNHYQRHIGAGFFTEWGDMHDYTNADFDTSIYWTSDDALYGKFYVDGMTGGVIHYGPETKGLGLCVTP